MMQDVRVWAEEQWGSAELGDARRTRRAVDTGAAMARHSVAGLPEQMQGWAAAKAAYRLLDRPEVTLAAVTAPHRAMTRAAAAASPEPVLFVQDGTCLDLTRHNAMTGRGRIGDDGGFGFLAHDCLALAAGDGRVLGLADLQVWARTQPPKKGRESRTARRKRRTEADVSAECVEAVGPCPEGCLWVSVGDREADVLSHVADARATGWHVLIRVCQDRRIAGGHLLPTLRGLAPMATRTVVLRNDHQRVVEVSVAWTAVTLRPARLRRDGRAALACAGVRVWGEGLEWLLLTTLPVDDERAAQEKVDWYCQRWTIEQYHKALKTGCRVEQRQVRTVERFLPLLGFYAVVAVRLLQLRATARLEPDAPTKEPPAMQALLAGALGLAVDRVATRRGFCHALARLGGFLGRKSDGEPGWQTLWRGHQALLLILLGADLATSGRSG
jgi:hypothetical protein